MPRGKRGEIISKVGRTTVRRSLHRMVRPVRSMAIERKRNSYPVHAGWRLKKSPFFEDSDRVIIEDTITCALNDNDLSNGAIWTQVGLVNAAACQVRALRFIGVRWCSRRGGADKQQGS